MLPPTSACKKRPYAELVSGTDQPLARVVPQHKAEVAGEAIQERVAPGGVGVQAQVGVRYFCQGGGGRRRKQRPKFVARIEPDSTDDPVLHAEIPDAYRLASG